ncbi:hypothetical protein K435DRAFT_790818 [Dendrothele bispora CBS 962.96]|uniref:Uncharacterized protein n=1 Tax=Dendrothele bispora (strain CBS 962.96) TaxID=1314807 RepID=A0A4S8MNP3_DENBC|nr:hypothetical protein K435DRAFT_790818 [Dendrothele bispora CBS 962.96]
MKFSVTPTTLSTAPDLESILRSHIAKKIKKSSYARDTPFSTYHEIVDAIVEQTDKDVEEKGRRNILNFALSDIDSRKFIPAEADVFREALGRVLFRADILYEIAEQLIQTGLPDGKIFLAWAWWVGVKCEPPFYEWAKKVVSPLVRAAETGMKEYLRVLRKAAKTTHELDALQLHQKVSEEQNADETLAAFEHAGAAHGLDMLQTNSFDAQIEAPNVSASSSEQAAAQSSQILPQASSPPHRYHLRPRPTLPRRDPSYRYARVFGSPRSTISRKTSSFSLSHCNVASSSSPVSTTSTRRMTRSQLRLTGSTSVSPPKATVTKRLKISHHTTVGMASISSGSGAAAPSSSSSRDTIVAARPHARSSRMPTLLG